jgi:hypothetical protein
MSGAKAGCLQNGRDVAIGCQETLRQLIDELRRRIVRDEVLGELVGDVASGGRTGREDVESPFSLCQTLDGHDPT